MDMLKQRIVTSRRDVQVTGASSTIWLDMLVKLDDPEHRQKLMVGNCICLIFQKKNRARTYSQKSSTETLRASGTHSLVKRFSLMYLVPTGRSLSHQESIDQQSYQAGLAIPETVYARLRAIRNISEGKV